MPENTTPTAAEKKSLVEAIRGSAGWETIDNLLTEVSVNNSRVKYLTIAASNIADGDAPTGDDRRNCVAYLLQAVEHFSNEAEAATHKLSYALSPGAWGEQS